MNKTKIIVYVPFHPELGFDWFAMTIEFNETSQRLCTGYKWYQIVVDGDKKEEIT